MPGLIFGGGVILGGGGAPAPPPAGYFLALYDLQDLRNMLCL